MFNLQNQKYGRYAKEEKAANKRFWKTKTFDSKNWIYKI